MASKCNLSDNSYSGVSARDKVLEHILQSEVELSPKEIATKLSINHVTTRVYVRRLLRDGKIVQPYPGSYCSKIAHGSIFMPLRVHNVVLGSAASWLVEKISDVVERVGGVKVRVQFGVQNRHVTGRVSCDEGMDCNAVLFALDRFFSIVFEKTGYSLDDVVVSTFEVNRDYCGVRLDAAHCFTRKGLFDVIERIYQKGNVVRHEVKVSRSMKVNEFQSLIQGGVSAYGSQQAVFMLMQKIDRLTEAQKYQNQILQAIVGRLQKNGL